jgi:hypothetical protein
MKRIMLKEITALIILIVFVSGFHIVSAQKTSKKPQYVVFKFDDLTNTNWKTWKTVTDIVIKKDVKADLGIFVKSLTAGDEEYNKYVQSIVNDPKHFEIWLHGYTGDADEFLYADYATQLDHIVKSRIVMLNKYDYILRDFQDHYNGGNQTTVKIINEEPFIKGWVYYQNSIFKNVHGVKPEKQCMPILNVYMEPKVGTVSYNKYISDWAKFKADTLAYVVIQGHAWGYRTDSLRNEFSKVVDDLKSKGVTFTHFRAYDRMIKGYDSDKIPPTVPARLRAKKMDDSHIKLKWKASKDKESGVDCYKIYRDGICINLSSTPEYTDEISGPHQYQVSAVNNNDLVSAKSAIASVK